MRVFAVKEANKSEVYLYGFGDMTEELCPIFDNKIKNPKITLDDNKGVIWGCQCWWGSVERYEEFIDGRNVIVVDMD